MIELKDLQLLTALARHQHFARAAEACNMSQPAFSMRIRSLEDRLGLSIVRRGNRFQGLTTEGLMIVERARGILDDAKALNQEIAAARGEVTGTLIIGVVPTATSYAAQLMDRMHQAHPRVLVRLEVTTSLSIQQRLYDGTLDVGVTYSDSVGRDDMSVLDLYDEAYVVFASERLLQGREQQMPWRDAAKLPLSLLEPQMQNRRILDRIFADLDLRPDIVSEASGFMASIVMARAGSVATILPQALVEALGPLESTKTLQLIEPEPSWPICLASIERQPELTTIRALKAVIAANSI